MSVFGSLRSRLRKRVVAALAQDPAWAILVHGKSWLCPYCAQVGVEKLPEEESARAEAILDHLVDAPCPNLHLGEGSPRPLAELKREASVRELRRKVKKELGRNPAWQLMDLRRHWFCPFCAEATQVTVPADRTMTEDVLRELVLHVENCFAYAHGRGEEKPLEHLKGLVKGQNRSRKLAEEVRRKIEGDPLWRQKDTRARWVCPFCLKVCEHVDLSTNLLMFENAPALIAKHLLSGCERWKAGAQPRMASGSGFRPPGSDGVAVMPERADKQSQDGEDEPPLPPMPQPRPVTTRRDKSEVWGRDAIQAAGARSDPKQKTLRQLESSGEFHLIDDPEVKKLVGRAPRASGSASAPASPALPDSLSASAEWRREIERELALVRSAVRGGPSEGSDAALEDTQQADAREAARAADGLPGFEVRVMARPTNPPRGDFVEVIRLDSQRLGFLLGGVAGEDGESALVSAMARNLLRIHARTERDPAAVLRKVNSEIFQDLDARTFVSAVYAILEGPTRRLTLARAGLSAPLLVNPRRNPGVQPIESDGMVMGIDKGNIFDGTIVSRTVELEAGDLVAFATNGILEVRNRSRDEFTSERYHHAVRRYGTHEAEYLVHKLGQVLDEFTKDSDPGADACVLALKLAEKP